MKLCRWVRWMAAAAAHWNLQSWWSIPYSSALALAPVGSLTHVEVQI